MLRGEQGQVGIAPAPADAMWDMGYLWPPAQHGAFQLAPTTLGQGQHNERGTRNLPPTSLLLKGRFARH